MAKSGSVSQRFPHFKMFLFLALLLGLPISVWAFNNAPTSIQQQAASKPKSTPINLEAKETCLNDVSVYNFSWKKVENASGYNFYYYYTYYEDGNGTVTKHKGPIKTISPNGTFSMQNVYFPKDTNYLYWYVSARNLSGNGPASDIAKATVACPNKQP